MRLVVFCPNLVGDAVMATPTLRALRTTYAEARIVAVFKPIVAATLEGGPWFDDVILYDPKSKVRERRNWSVLNRLRAERFDLAVLLPNSMRSGLLASLSNAKRRIGYDRGDRAWLLTDRLTYKIDANGRRLPSPIVEDYLAIARKLGCRVDSLKTELHTTPVDELAADRAWDRLGLPTASTGRVVALNTGGAFGPAKNWPLDHFITLARRLVDELNVHVLVLCGPGERTAALEIARRSERSGIVSLADEPLGIGLSKACVRRSALLITTDSGPRHFAGAFDVPVLTLFGPTHIAWTRTQHPLAKHIFHPVPCGPCQKPICPLGHQRCMIDLAPDDVFEAAAGMLKKFVPEQFHHAISHHSGAYS